MKVTSLRKILKMENGAVTKTVDRDVRIIMRGNELRDYYNIKKCFIQDDVLFIENGCLKGFLDIQEIQAVILSHE